jgi:hypothetical protein
MAMRFMTLRNRDVVQVVLGSDARRSTSAVSYRF